MSIDDHIRRHSETVREDRTQRANDQLLAQGKPLKHCGVEASKNGLGDWVCRRCGDIF